MPIVAPPSLDSFLDAERRRHPAIHREAPSSSQSGPGGIDRLYLKELLAVSDSSNFHRNEQAYNALSDELSLLKILGPNWDTYGAPPPSSTSILSAERILHGLRSVGAVPAGIRPSAEGGIGICFAAADAYGHIEILNDGTIFGLAYNSEREPDSWQLDDSTESLKAAYQRIRAYLQPR